MKQDANKAMAGVRVRSAERMQVVWQAQCVDDLLPAGHQARVIWAVVGTLDLSAFYDSIKAREGEVGRDSTDPRILVASGNPLAGRYASVRGIGSARELDRLCKESRPYQTSTSSLRACLRP